MTTGTVTGGFIVNIMPISNERRWPSHIRTQRPPDEQRPESRTPDIGSRKMSAFCLKMRPGLHNAGATGSLERWFLFG